MSTAISFGVYVTGRITEQALETQKKKSAAAGGLWSRTKKIVIDQIIGLHDTPHRIALGVFLGFVVGWSPTMGLQLPLYLIAAWTCRANRVSGIPVILLTNPLTAVPIYAVNWKVGAWFLDVFRKAPDSVAESHQMARLKAFVDEFSLANLFDGEYWRNIWPTLKSLSVELIVGCLIVGVICGILGYGAAYYGVIAYRKRRNQSGDFQSRAR
ncbi:MAG TPA: DUF2062 domain-containing protein [Phycisphaerae bacterium]|nr:DUF2062 domain-containing protein [Phycisphaerae bacterium]